MISERDNWCSPQQVQGHMHVIRLRGGDASFRLFADAAHSFDRETARESLPDAAVAPNAPTVYIADDGAMAHPPQTRRIPHSWIAISWSLPWKPGFGAKRTTIGSKGEQPAQMRADMSKYWRESLGLH